ncbi:MAG TPA: translation initiation factor IF-3 [Chthoniobacterales bacterium]
MQLRTACGQPNPGGTINLKDIRVNERIRAREVRVIDGTNNQQIGVMAIGDAVRRARSMGLDLVEVSPNAVPPVCRIVDYGKFRYDLSKQDKDRKHSSAGKIKEVKFRVNIDQHDYETKLRHAEEFLDKGFKVKVHLQFRGREMAHQDLGMKVMIRVKNDLIDMGQVDMDPKLVGKAISMTLSPLPASKRKRKFHLDEAEEAEAPEPSLSNRLPLPTDLPGN